MRAHAQTPAQRAWFTTVGEVRATEDGWVELQFAPGVPLPPHYSRLADHGAGAARFSPTRVRDWALAARRAVDDTLRRSDKVDVPGFTNGTAAISFAVVHDSKGARYEMYAWGCRNSSGAGPTRAEVLLLTDALLNASRVASSLRSVPLSLGQGPFSRPQVTCPARVRVAAMPAWPATLGRRPAARGEALAHFVVMEDGRIDLATLTWDHPLAASAARRARAALARWTYDPAQAEGRTVRQWTHASIWFADSADADERLLARWTRTRSFVARGDGRVAHTPFYGESDSLWRMDEAPPFREAYPPAAVRAWLSGLVSGDSLGPALAVAGGVTRKEEESGRAYYQGCAPNGSLLTQGITVSGRESQLDSIRAALAQAERVALRAIDSTRVHGEMEVTCPARPRETLPPTLTGWPGAGEVVLSFVVTRNGHVDPASVTAMGVARSADLAAAREALVALRWEPGRLSGVAVPQRAHLVLYPAERRGLELTPDACAQAYTSAVHLRVRETTGGITGAELTGVAHAMSERLGLQGRPPATDGSFVVTLDDSGRAHFFSWIRLPTDSAGADVVRSALRDRIASSIPGAPLVLDVELARACP